MTPYRSRQASGAVSLTVWAVTTVLALVSWATPATGEPTVPAGAVSHQLRLATHAAATPTDTHAAAEVADPNCNPRATLRPPASMPTPGAMPAGSAMARIAQRGFLIAGVDQNTFLFGYRDPRTGTLDGFETEIVRAIAKAIFGDENRVEFRQVNIADRLRLVEGGDIDLVVNTLTITCERRDRVEFSGVYFEAGQRILVDQGSQVTSLAGLAGKRVCAARGSTSLQRMLTDPAKPIPVGVPNSIDCLVALQLGEVDAISTDDTLLAGMAAQDPRTTIVGGRFTEEPYGIAVHRESPELARFVNGVLARRVADGSWTASYRRWLSPLGPPPAPPTLEYRD